MAILERMILRIAPGKWEAMKAQEKAWDALEAKAGGFPQKRRYQGYSGAVGTDHLVIEREWESLALYEAAYTRMWSSPDVQAIAEADAGIKLDQHIEFYGVIDQMDT